jgi:hypothetical protein
MAAPQKGAEIALELARTHAQKPYEVSQWSPTFSGNHVPERFGTLIFK